MKSSNLSHLLSELYNHLHKEQVQVDYEKHPKNKERIIDLCQQIVLPLQAGLNHSQRSAACAVFSMLCDPVLFSRLDLWNDDEKIMHAALALHAVLPDTFFQAYHIKHLANYFSQSCTLGSPRNRLICSLLQGPKEHWQSNEIENMYYTFMEMAEDMSAEKEHHNQPLSPTTNFLAALETLSRSTADNCKSAKDTLYKTALSLLCDDQLKLYPDIFNKLDGYTLVKKCIQLQHLHGRVMENLDRMISDQQLEQWFPKSGKRVHVLAQSYPRLQSMLEKRNLHENLSQISKISTSRQHKM